MGLLAVCLIAAIVAIWKAWQAERASKDAMLKEFVEMGDKLALALDNHDRTVSATLAQVLKCLDLKDAFDLLRKDVEGRRERRDDRNG